MFLAARPHLTLCLVPAEGRRKGEETAVVACSKGVGWLFEKNERVMRGGGGEKRGEEREKKKRKSVAN